MEKSLKVFTVARVGSSATQFGAKAQKVKGLSHQILQTLARNLR